MLRIFILFFIMSIAALAEDAKETVDINQPAWRCVRSKYSNETITYFMSGDLSLDDKSVAKSGDQWSGTGTVIGVDDQAKMRFFGTFTKGIKNGWFLISGGQGVPFKTLDWFQWSEGKLTLHKMLLQKENGALVLDGAAVP